MQTRLVGFTTTVTGGLAWTRSEEERRIKYRQLPTLPTTTSANVTVIRKDESVIRFRFQDLQMPLIMDAECTSQSFCTPPRSLIGTMSHLLYADNCMELMRQRCPAVGNLTLPAQLTFRGDLVADMVVGCALFCGAKGSCKLQNGTPKCVCDCGWNGFGCSLAEGFCPLPVSYMLPGNTSNVPAAGMPVHMSPEPSAICPPPQTPHDGELHPVRPVHAARTPTTVPLTP